MSKLALVSTNDQLMIVRPSEELLNNSNIDEVVTQVQVLLNLRCQSRAVCWMVTDGTIRIQHYSEQETIKKVLGLETQASSTNANQS